MAVSKGNTELIVPCSPYPHPDARSCSGVNPFRPATSAERGAAWPDGNKSLDASMLAEQGWGRASEASVFQASKARWHATAAPGG